MKSRRSVGVPPRRGRSAVVAGVLAVAVMLVAPASGVPDPSIPGQSDIPAPGTYANTPGFTALAQTLAARRSKVWIEIGADPQNPMIGALYTFLYNRPADNPTEHFPWCNPRRGSPLCAPNPFDQPTCIDPDNLDTQRRGLFFGSAIFPLVPRSPRPADRLGADVGKFADAKVTVLAFGSIPATATLEIRIPKVGGKLQPLYAWVWQSNREGCDVVPGAPPVDALVEGGIDIRMTSLQVDGVDVPVGPSCRTREPAKLQMWGDVGGGGYFPGGGGLLGAWDGLHKGSRGPLTGPFYEGTPLKGRTLPPSTGMTIPPFSGCGVGGENLDPVITAMASGPNNPVAVRQNPVTFWEQGLDVNDVRKCLPEGQVFPCPYPGPGLPPRPPLPAGD